MILISSRKFVSIETIQIVSFWQTGFCGQFLLQLHLWLQMQSYAAAPQCQDLTVTVTPSANNAVIPAVAAPTSTVAFSAISQTLLGTAFSINPLVPVSGTLSMSARYCEPEMKVATRANTVQLPMHPLTEMKLYWSSLGYPVGFGGDTHSWITCATRQGYPTLSIDRVGNGNSTHPDPVFLTQTNTDHIARFLQRAEWSKKARCGVAEYGT